MSAGEQGALFRLSSEFAVWGQVAAASAAAGGAGVPRAWRLSGGALPVLPRNAAPFPGLGPFGGRGRRACRGGSGPSGWAATRSCSGRRWRRASVVSIRCDGIANAVGNCGRGCRG